MQSNLCISNRPYSPNFTALNIHDSVFEQVGRRVSLKKLDGVIDRIEDLVQQNKNHPIDIKIFTSDKNNRLVGELRYKKANYVKLFLENEFYTLIRRNPQKFIEKCCREADVIRETFMA